MARDDDPRPPIEIVGQEPSTTTTQRVETVGGARRRNALVAVGVVVAVVVAGLALGGGGDGEEETAPSRSSTTSTTERETSTTERSATTTTTIPSGPVFGEPVDADLVVYVGNRWSTVDLDTGARRDLEQIPSTEEAYGAVPVGGGLVLVASGEARFYAVTEAAADGGPVVLGEANRVLGAGRPDQVWIVDDADIGVNGQRQGRSRATLVALDGRVRLRVDLDESDVGLATSEGILLGRGGRVYLVGERGPRPIAEGSLVGVAGDRVVVLQCDDRAACEHHLHELGGSSRVLEGVQVTGDYGSTVIAAPDGRFALVAFGYEPGGAPSAALFDAAGEPIGRVEGSTAAEVEALPVWLPRGAGLLASAGGPVRWLHETDEGWVVDEVPGLAELQAVEVLLVIPR